MKTRVKLFLSRSGRVKNNALSHRKAGFSMIEMIGVLAIMAILASVLAPAGLRTIERAAVRGETSTLKELAEHIRLYAQDRGALPGANTWSTDITGPLRYSSLNAAEILTNRRQMNRLYVVDAANGRAMVISSMRTGVNLPTYAQVSGNFQAVWDTPAETVPFGPGWNAWNAANVEFLTIVRVNCRRELQTFPITLKNSTPAAPGTIVTYATVPLSGTGSTGGSVTSGNQATVMLRTGDRINLYRPPGGILDYTHVVGSRGATFEFNGTTWFSPSTP